MSSIKVVSELTGLQMGTLRAWERRYGFPKPTRREGSNRRVYSNEQIERLRSVAQALERGYRPGDVIPLDPAGLQALLENDSPARGAPGGRAIADVQALIALLLRDEVRRIEDELRLAAAAMGPKRFVTELAQPLAQAVGQAWAAGTLAIRQEHVMTECLTTQLRGMLAAQPDADGSPTIVLATLPGETHTLGLQMVAVYVAFSAAKPRLLGANTPPEQLIAAAEALGARVVGIALTPAADLVVGRRELQRLARGLPLSVALWVGGGGARALGQVSARIQPVDSWFALDAALARARQPLARS
ncbi:MAG TPA: MerR family transcriptional regulator [Polyangiaceae bacterium]|nr:MerR family transcriptional regulator [Polyangiaceae bacterium]